MQRAETQIYVVPFAALISPAHTGSDISPSIAPSGNANRRINKLAASYGSITRDYVILDPL